MAKICLVGTPNVGKSTLFNSLTGARQHTVNAPGTTVALATGKWENHEIIDLPGFYSFATISPDEEVAAHSLVDMINRPDACIMVIDGTHPTKSLYLYAQLRELQIPTVVVCTMMDLVAKRSLKNSRSLQNSRSTKKSGETNADIFTEKQLKDVTSADAVVFIDGRYPDRDNRILEAINSLDLESKPENTPDITADKLHTDAVNNADVNFNWVANVEEKLGLNKVHRRTKSDILDAILLNSISGPLIFLALMFVCFLTVTTFSDPFIVSINGAFYDMIANIVPDDNVWGAFFMHGIFDGIVTVLGFLPPLFFMFVYLGLMEASGILSRTAVVADRLMRLIGLDGRALMPLIMGYGCNLPAISATRIIPDSRLRKLTTLLIPFTLCSARLAVFTVLILAFFPGIASFVLFGMYLLSILAIILVGLILRPFVVKKGANNPFIIALPPFQLPVFRNLFKSIGVKLLQFISEAGKIIIGITLIVWLLQSIPLPGAVNRNVPDISDESGNGTFSVGINDEPASFANVDDIHQSVFGFICDGITPIFKPLGFGDWHFSAALVSGFVAKEAFVGTLEQVYNVDNDDSPKIYLYDENEGGMYKVIAENMYTPDGTEVTHYEKYSNSSDENDPGNRASHLSGALSATITQTSDEHNFPAALSLLLFILLYTPCMATIVLIGKEFNVKTAFQSLFIGLITAYIVSLLVFQIGSLF